MVLFGMGATKAGTSWLYRYLHDHPECRLRAIKEMHFFDTIDGDDFAHQLAALDRARADLAARHQAAPAGWRRGNLARQIADAEALIAVLICARDRGEAAALPLYRAFLMGAQEGLAQDAAGQDSAGQDAAKQAGQGRLCADITPAYGLLAPARLAMMAAFAPLVRVLYLMRDPLDRLWSHVRMQASRQLRAGEDLAVKAGRILNRVVRRGLENHVARRGDYRDAVTRLRAGVPAGQLCIGFSEDLRSETGLRALCAFLGIAYRPGDGLARVHAGPALAMAPAQERQALAYLAPQYAFVEQNFGPLPERWQANMVRIAG